MKPLNLQPLLKGLHALLPCARQAAPLMAASALLASATASDAQSWGRPTRSSPIAISLNDRLIWVVNPSDDSVSVIRPDTNKRITKVPVGDEPESIALTPDGQYAYVANAAAGTVTVIRISDPAWGTFSADRRVARG